MCTALNQKILQYNKQVPRYTSYPTAPHFSDAVNADTYTRWLQELPKDATLSLYLHVPFCPKLCWYCGCHTKATQRYAPVEDYAHLLKREIRLIREILGRQQRVTHIHFGGGSPTILRPNDFELLMEEIQHRFTLDERAEIAIELDPRGVNESKIATYAKAGVNRASIGVQDFHQNVQDAINRRQPFHTIYDSVKLLRDYGVDQINMDLMYGLPKQTLDGLKENISYALLFEPDRIALFGYAHVPWMKKQMRLIDEEALPGSEERLLMFQTASQKLKQAGYAAVGLDHFVRKDDTMLAALQDGSLRRNFQGYTTDSADALIGFGVSSISKLPQGYAQNTLNNRDYEKALKSKKPAIIKGISSNREDHLRHDIIEQIMCQMEVDLSSICADYNEPEQSFTAVLEALAPLQNDQLIEIDGSIIRIHPDAPQAARFVCAAFDQYYADNTKKHAQVA